MHLVRKIMVPLALCALTPIFALDMGGAGSGLAGMGGNLNLSSDGQLLISNRILIRLPGTTITVMDVVRKMDIHIYRQYPQISDAMALRYHFYRQNWREVLKIMIDDALILADAKEKKVEVSEGDVREEIERIFGPNVVANVEKLGLKLDDVQKMIENELISRKMLGGMVHAKALTDLHPKNVRAAYNQFLLENPPQDTWHYEVISIRGGNEEEREKVANTALSLIKEHSLSFGEIPSQIDSEEVTITLSEPFERSDNEISLAHKAILQTLEIGQMSTPNEVVTRRGEKVIQLFHLVERAIGEVPAFSEIEAELSKKLLHDATVKRSAEYLEHIYNHFDIDQAYISEKIPENFSPFSMK